METPTNVQINENLAFAAYREAMEILRSQVRSANKHTPRLPYATKRRANLVLTNLLNSKNALMGRLKTYVTDIQFAQALAVARNITTYQGLVDLITNYGMH